MTATTTRDQTQVFVVREYQRVTVPCSNELAAKMHAEGHVRVSPSPIAGHHDVTTRQKVGVLRYGSLELRIVPKVPVSRLLYLSTFLKDDESWHQIETMLDDVDDSFSAIAHALAFYSERALRPTPLQGYVTHEQAEMQVRGRLLFDRQLSSRAGIPLPAELRYDEYELGIAENRVLKAALLVVARFVRNPLVAARLRHQLAQLDGVEPWMIGQPVPEFSFGRMNERYRGALALAKVVLEGRSLEYSRARKAGTAFLFNMNTVFEAYLESSLRLALGKHGGRVEGQHKTWLDIDDSVLMRPDVTWWRNGRCAAVIDAKYKRAKSENYPNADAYQMFAYCTRLGLRRGYLVYADLDGKDAGRSVIRNSGIEIVVTSLDIGGTIPELTASVEDLATEIASTTA